MNCTPPVRQCDNCGAECAEYAVYTSPGGTRSGDYVACLPCDAKFAEGERELQRMEEAEAARDLDNMRRYKWVHE